MELISVTILRPIGTRNGLFWGDCHEESPRKSMRDLPGRTGEPGSRSQVTEVRTYIRVQPCCPVCALCEAEDDGIRMPHPPSIAPR